MNISFENPDKVNGVLTLTIEKDDYQAEVDKTLKDYRKKANVPGFRVGQAPIGLIKRQFGASVKADVVNKLIGKNLNDYIKDNNIDMLGEPLANANQVPQDLEADGPYTFIFDIAVAPEFKIELTADDSIDYYDIDVDDKLVSQQVEMFQSRAGHYDKVEEYDGSQNDMLKGDLRELDADGNAKEDGIVVEAAVLMPEYIKVDDQRALFDGAKLGSVITFNPKKAYPESNAEIKSLLKIDDAKAEELTSDFTFLVTEISRYTKAEVNQELFDQIYGKDNVKDEADFRQKIAEGIKNQLKSDTDYKFLLDVRAYAENKVGELTFPNELLKRIMLNNNQEKGEAFVNEHFDASIKELKWSLIKNQLVKAAEIKIEDADVKAVAVEAARIQFAQYGMNNVPEEYLEKYANDMLKDKNYIDNLVERAIDVKLADAVKKVVKLNQKTISLDDFNKMMQEK
ncbi:trigger factor [Prevotella sp. P2-180]|uniref:trigger factor n=1 Tax=Prevotella sp. P2-180 TaxID=2024224 RepID=UPI000B964A01|nr:trigger factor [Prevotella sp. P2-180]MCI7257392.1 trigger factor [Prevotella sp.]MDD5785460.1 trigger factor [Prevotella sp.]MDD7224828.1 trigger factor [Prevotella sp.]MDY4498098.1 trigger factor [Prevotella sp.]OYP66781.1 trigger factor [Prevotella sp. P2-180]